MTPPPPPSISQAMGVLAAQPFSQLLGASLLSFGDGEATIEVPLTPDHLQQHALAHGGLLAYAADNAVTFAGGSVLGPDVLTAGLTLDYVTPARGSVVRARATVIHHDARVAVCHGTVEILADGSWTVCAVAQGSVRIARRVTL